MKDEGVNPTSAYHEEVAACHEATTKPRALQVLGNKLYWGRLREECLYLGCLPASPLSAPLACWKDRQNGQGVYQ